MIRRIALAAFLVALSVGGFGCDFGFPTPPIVPLTSSQVSQVLACQHIIKLQGQNFLTVKLTDVEACLDEVLAVQLPFENGLGTSATYQAGLTKARLDCYNKFQHIGAVSTTMIDSIVSACAPVESIILPPSGYDPLEFGVLAELAKSVPSAGGPFTNVTELAGAICEAKEEAVDWMLFTEVPRMGNLLDILDEDTTGGPFGFVVEHGVEVPNIPLDDRCNEDLIFGP